MANPEPQKLVPGGVEKEPEIHTIPEQFLGAAAKAKIPKSAKKKAPKSAAPAVPPLPGAPSPQVPKKKGGKSWLLIPIFAILFLILLGVGTWFLLRPPAAEPETEQSPATVIIQQPTETVEEPVIEEEPVEEEEPDEIVEEEPEPLPSSDGDADGLSLAEEELYGTSDENSDTDGDGFMDMLEVTNLYNPAGFTPTRLEDAGLVRTFAKDGAYQLLIPSTWFVNELETGAVQIFDAESVEERIHGFLISSETNQEGLSLLDWYLNKNPGATAAQVEEIVTKSDDIGLQDAEGNAYFLGDGVIHQFLSLTDDPSGASIYASTFLMMINSFAVEL